MKIKNNKIVILDTNIVINFLKIKRVDLLRQHPFEFKITDHILDEITYEKQRDLLEKSISDGTFEQVSLATMEELVIFAKLTSRGNLGMGECSAIAYAIYHKHTLAIDDGLATKVAKNMAEELMVGLEVLSTQDIILSLINEGILSISEADEIKDDWALNHRFKLKIDSFSSLIVKKC